MQVDIDTVQKNTSILCHDYAIDNLVYVENKGIYCKLYYKKQGTYRINEVLTNGTVIFQRGAINSQMLPRLV